MAGSSRILAALAGAMLVSGCASFGTMQTASTVGRGHTRIALEPSMWGAALPSGSALVPVVAVSGEYGLTDRFDLGARVGTPGVEVWGKVRLTAPRSTLVVSLAPSVGGFAPVGGTGGGAAVFVRLPVLLGVRFGVGELVLGPEVHDWLVLAAPGADTGRGSLLSVGGTVGFALRLGSGFRVMPEVAVLRPVAGSVTPGRGQATLARVFDGQAVLLQAGVSLMFGN